MAEIQGQVERITFQNEENGWTIARLKQENRLGLVTIAGNLPGVTAGEELKITGNWTRHPKYGDQFSIVSFETTVPSSVVGIKKYLGSGLIKGIGPVMAGRIVELFGADTLDIIENDINRLKEVGGIAKGRIEMIRVAWDEQKEIKNVMLFLRTYNVSVGYAVKIYRKFGQDTIKILQDNPYHLTEIFGIGFITADKIAEKLGVPKDSPMRAEAGIIYVLYQLSNDGHVYYPYSELMKACEEMLEIEESIIGAALGRLQEQELLIIDQLEDEQAVYLSQFHHSETGVARKFLTLLNNHQTLLPGFEGQGELFAAGIDTEALIADIEKEMDIRLEEHQKEAVLKALTSKILVITGGPGVGKTATVNAIIRAFRAINRSVLLAAPTGRASKRMNEVTGHEAKTIHRLLEFSPNDGKFKHNETNPLRADLIVLDEVSMVDTILMHHFMKAVPRDACLVLVGDVDQLPSVGPGNVLRDVIESETLPVVRLTKVFRQAAKSYIIRNAHRVNTGQMPELPEGNNPVDFQFFEMDDTETAAQIIVELCKLRLPHTIHVDPIRDIQVLTPMYRGVIGATNLNERLQQALNPRGEQLIWGNKAYRIGDKVLQIRNNYDLGVYNGDIGIVLGFDREEREVRVDFDGRTVVYDFNDLDELVLAYATTIHKAQGSEYPVVVMPVHETHYIMLQRNLIYTGISRAKRMLALVGTKKGLHIAVGRAKVTGRYTKLRDRLRGLL